MHINFESLEQIPQLIKMMASIQESLNNINTDKRWLTTEEAAEYTRHAKETFVKKLKSGSLIKGYHYHKRDGLLLFDIQKLDEWAMGISPFDMPVVNEILASVVTAA